MARKKEATWEGEPQFRWSKMVDGKRYRVNCRKLGLPRDQWTKEASLAKANAYFESLTAGLLTVANAKKATDAIAIQTLLAQHQLNNELIRNYQKREELVNTLQEVLDNPKELITQEVKGRAVSDHLRSIPLDDRAVPYEKTISALAERWNSERAGKAREGLLSAKGTNNQRMCLEHFVEFLGKDTEPEAIDRDKWESWYTKCAGKTNGWSVDYKKKVFGVSRTFVRWLYENEVLPVLPRNFASKLHRFEGEHKDPPTFSFEDIRNLLGNASEKVKLFILLMLNCGMTQKDISDLRKDQIDLIKGTITRRRSKTKNNKSTPIVCYHLWEPTLELLKANLAPEGEVAFLTKSGGRWVWNEIQADGKTKGSDNILTVFNNLKRKIQMTGKNKTLKVFRKTSATKLKNTQFSDLRFYFLGHSERSIADRHYAGNLPEDLKKATDWLREQYGL